MSGHVHGNKRCICQLCECGRHRCPKDSRAPPPQGEPTQTEYHENFPVWEYNERRQMIRPIVRPKDNDIPLASETSYKMSYPGHKPKWERVRKYDMYQPPQIPMVTSTIYRAEYVHKDGKPEKSARPCYSYKAPTQPLQKATVYGEEYQPYTAQQYANSRVPNTIRRGELKTIDVPLDGVSITKTDFPNHGHKERRQPCLPRASSWSVPANKIDDKTVYSVEYNKKIGDRAKIKKPSDQYHPPNIQMETTTVSKNDFPNHGHRERRGQCRPRDEYKPTLTKCESMTTFRNAFGAPGPVKERPPWPTWAIPGVFKPPLIPFDGSTVHKEDYVLKPASKRSPIRPKYVYEYKSSTNPPTTYQQDYPGHKGRHVAESMREGLLYKPPLVRMDCTTEMKTRYSGMPGERRGLLRPDHRLIQSDMPMGSDTSYKAAFRPPNRAVCPTSQIPLFPPERRAPGFVAHTERGDYRVVGQEKEHIYYARVADAASVL